MKKIVIFGATSSIAEHCARLWITEACHLILVGRNFHKLSAIADDLKVRNENSTVETVVAQYKGAEDVVTGVDQLWLQLGNIDIALIAQGTLSDQIQSQINLVACEESLSVNAVIPLLIAEALAKKMALTRRGQIAVIGSVAGDRGRKSNYIYGAAKGMIDIYLQGMQHRFADSHIYITLIKPGPTETPMTAHLTTQGVKMAKATQVAKDIVNAINKKKRALYTPSRWALIMMIIKRLPFAIFKKLNI